MCSFISANPPVFPFQIMHLLLSCLFQSYFCTFPNACNYAAWFISNDMFHILELMTHFQFWIVIGFSSLSIYALLFYIYFRIYSFRMNFPFCLSPNLNISLKFSWRNHVLWLFNLQPSYILWCVTLPILDFWIFFFNVCISSECHYASPLFTFPICL